MPTIESFGNTTLSTNGSTYTLSSVGATLYYGGSPVTVGQFGAWEPWSAEIRSITLDVVFRNATTSQFIVWTVDLNGNYLGQAAPLSGTSYALQSLETGFSHDLNGDGTVGPKTGATIEAVGTYKLVQQADAYAIMPTASSTGVVLKLGGTVVASGQFAGWTPVGVAQTSLGFEVAWKNGSQFLVWQTDSNGNYLWDALRPTSGAVASFQVKESVFSQDLNGDGTIGVKTTSVETDGATTLTQVANTYFLYANGTSTGPQLSRGAAAVTVDQYAGWTAIGAEKTTYGYEVAWKNAGTGQYIVWATDANGNYVSDIVGPVSGSSAVLRAFEASFAQDLNSDAALASSSTIDALGTTGLTQNNGYFFLGQIGVAPGPALRFGGALVTAAQFGEWKPIAAEKTASGYEVVWQLGSADQYTVWTTDSSGNWLSQGPTVSGLALQARETTFSQDLNGDTTVGEVTVGGETEGATDLMQVGNGYLLYAAGTSTGPQLKYGGAAYAVGQFGAWTPIAAEKTTGGYQVAWKAAGSDQYLVWMTDANGNFLSQTAVMSGASSALKAFEPGFDQDLNGDTQVASPVSIEADGTTRLVQVFDRYFLNTVGGTWGPELSRGGTPVTAGQYGTWSPIGAEKTTGGYMVAWKDSASGQYIVWATDNAGNYLSDVTGPVAGSSTDLRALEPAFAQNLNGDGGTESALPATESDGNTSLVQALARYFLKSSGGTWGPELRMGGTPVTLDQFAGWTPIQAEKNSAGYLVGWQNGSQFIFWTTDSAGNYQSDSGVLAQSSIALGTYEAIFNKDFNASGSVAASSTMESVGTTSLHGVGSNFFLKSADNAGVVLKYGGSPLRMNQFENWAPIAAEQTAIGYQVVFKNSVTQLFVEWTTDSNGNFVSQSGPMSQGSGTLQALEAVYSQDLNGDGQTGLSTTTIETAGATSLVAIAGGYYLGGASGPLLKFGGTAVTLGQFGTWAPIAAEQTATGYEVAWKMAGADQYIVWLTDGSGNFSSYMGGPATGASYALQTVETSFSQDLNGDGTVGAVSTQIEANGWSSLVKVANNYFIYETGSTNGPMLKFGGAAVTEGQFPSWTPVAAEKTATGYDIAWKWSGGFDQYRVWATDNDGNYQSTLVSAANELVMTSFEPIFHQDFTDSGTTIASVTTIESVGSTSLLGLNGNYFVSQSGGSMLVPLLYGSGFASGFAQFSGWTAYAATATATGYQVAWRHSDGVQNVVWNTDSAGHLLSSSSSMFGSSSAFESYESSFQQDLNGDGFIGVAVPNFNIKLDFGTDGPDATESQYMSHFNAAVARWQQIIVGDLGSETHSTYGSIDDILIAASVRPIDGSNNVLGQGGPDFVRWNDIPYLGHLEIDTFDIDRIAADGRLVYTIEHEIGHALGFNATIWNWMGLLDGNGRYIGEHGLYAYRMLSGNQSAAYVPTSGGHLLEGTFGKELMTSTMTTAGDPISIVTIGILEDMGYEVNYSAADPYSLPAGLVASAQSSSVQGNSDALQGGEPIPTLPEDWLVR